MVILEEVKPERLIVQLTKEQKRFIENKSEKTGRSQAEIVREAINQYVVKEDE